MSDEFRFDIRTELYHLAADRIQKEHLSPDKVSQINQEGWQIPRVGSYQLSDDRLSEVWDIVHSRARGEHNYSSHIDESRDPTTIRSRIDHFISRFTSTSTSRIFLDIGSAVMEVYDKSYQDAKTQSDQGWQIIHRDDLYTDHPGQEDRVEAIIRFTPEGHDLAWAEARSNNIDHELSYLSGEMLFKEHLSKLPPRNESDQEQDQFDPRAVVIARQINESPGGWQVPEVGSFRLADTTIGFGAMIGASYGNEPFMQPTSRPDKDRLTDIAMLVLDDGKIKSLAEAHVQNESPMGWQVHNAGAFKFSDQTLEKAWNQLHERDHSDRSHEQKVPEILSSTDERSR